ncbi:MAG: 50S ribosomal protein L11 methyltransferase [Anaerolineae bacterium]
MFDQQSAIDEQQSGQWLEVCVMTEPETAEAVSEVLSRYAPNGVAIEQLARDIGLGADEGAAQDLEQIVAVRAYLSLADEVDRKKQQIEEALWHLSRIAHIPEPTFRVVAESDWANAWREHYHVVHLGDRFVIKPSWREYEAQPSEIVIELDPGMAFGTGLHPTTQMCLAAIEKYAQPDMHTLDLGTGSGILAIGAAMLGVKSIVAIDNDPVAVKAAIENVQMNHVEAAIKCSVGSLAEAAADTYDLIVVNILARVIIAMCEDQLGRVVRSGGLAIFAGLIDTQEYGVREALDSQGLRVIDRLQDKDWICLIARKD